jgi:two-component system sensor histidine kinase QseC
VKSIRARLTLALLLGGAALMALMCVAAHERASALLTAQFDDGLRARCTALVSLLATARQGMEFEYHGETMPEYEQPEGDFAFEIWRVDGAQQVFERSRSLRGGDLPQLGRLRAEPEFCTFPGADGRPRRAVGMHATVTEDEDGRTFKYPPVQAVVVVAGDASGLQARLRAFALELLVGGVGGLLLLAIVIRLVLRQGLAPLKRLSDHAATLDASSLHQQFPSAGMPTELAPICTKLNELLARIDEAFDRERRFSADVAHELRTPIAELRTLSEVGASLAGSAATETDVADFFNDAHEISDRMERTVSTLLMLARCEGAAQPPAFATFDLRNVLEPLCADASEAANARRVIFEDLVPRGLRLPSHRDLLERLFQILLENAVEYTEPQGRVVVQANHGGVTISNGPVDLELHDLPHLFERFWRKDPSRTDSRHAGLGLALAAELAKLLRLRLLPDLSADHTFRLTVDWSSSPSRESPDE